MSKYDELVAALAAPLYTLTPTELKVLSSMKRMEPNVGERAEHIRENARLQPLLALLGRALEALALRKMHDDDCADSTEKFAPHEMCECGASVVKDVLAEADKLLGGG